MTASKEESEDAAVARKALLYVEVAESLVTVHCRLEGAKFDVTSYGDADWSYVFEVAVLIVSCVTPLDQKLPLNGSSSQGQSLPLAGSSGSTSCHKSSAALRML